MEDVWHGRSEKRRLDTAVCVSALVAVAVLAWAALGATARPADASKRTAPLARLYEISSRLSRGDGALVAIRVSRSSTCALTLRRGRLGAGPFRAIVGTRYAVWTWQVPKRARAGTWAVRIGCRAGHRHGVVRTHLKLLGSGGSGKVARGRGMSTAVSNTPPGGRQSTGPQGTQLGGKGGGNVCLDPSQPGSVLDSGGYCTGNCTHYVWTQRRDLTYLGNAWQWRDGAAARGIPSGQQPVVGAVAWWDRRSPKDLGHVALVTAVSGSTYTVHEMNHAGYNIEDDRHFTIGQPGGPNAFIYGGPAAGAEYIGHIVQWDGDTKQQKTAWLVINDNGHARRNWIKDSATFYCLKGQGAPGPDVLPASVLSKELPDENGVAATCAGRGGESGETPSPVPTAPPPTPTPTLPPVIPPPARTFSEQETPNHPVNTFTDYHNASGIGPAVAAGQWVQVSCKVYDGTIASVKPDGYWYRIASAPWNNAYYAPANTFMNGDPYGGPYTHNTDFAVPDC